MTIPNPAAIRAAMLKMEPAERQETTAVAVFAGRENLSPADLEAIRLQVERLRAKYPRLSEAGATELLGKIGLAVWIVRR